MSIEKPGIDVRVISESIETPSLQASKDESLRTSSSGLNFLENFNKKWEEAQARAGLSPAAVDWNRESVQEHLQVDLQSNIDGRSLPLREALSDSQDISVQEPQGGIHDSDHGALQGHISEDDDEIEDEDEAGNGSLRMRSFGSTDHVVLMPMASTVREVYKDEIPKWGPEISELHKAEHVTPQTLNKIDKLITNLKLLGDHQDLFCDDVPQEPMNNDTVSKWALTCSPKCLFLERLLESLRLSSMHIAVLVRPGRMLDILAAIMDTHNFKYTRPDNATQSGYSAYGAVTVTLLPTGLEGGGQYVVSPADAVIAFDSSFFEGERYSHILRAHTYDPRKLAPLLILVTEDSAEHIDLCLPKALDPNERKSYLIDFVCRKREVVGQHTHPRPEDAAPPIAQYLRSASEAWSTTDEPPSWPLAQSLNITELGISDSLFSQQSESPKQLEIQQTAMLAQNSNVFKRAHDGLTSEDSSKRLRMTPVPHEMASGADVPHVSGTLGFQTQANVLIDSSSGMIDLLPRDNEQQAGQMTYLLAKVAELQSRLQAAKGSEARVNELEAQLRSKVDLVSIFRHNIMNLESRISEQANLIDKFQPLWQNTLGAKRQAETSSAKTETQVTTLSWQLGVRDAENSSLKAKVSSLEEKLESVTTNSLDPIIKEYGELQVRTKTLEEENSKLEKRLASTTRDFEFTREQYQKVTSSAVTLSDEIKRLNEINAKLLLQADANRVRISEIQAESESKQLMERIGELGEEVELLQVELWKKNEELKARGPRGLRGISVPRSPKVAGQNLGSPKVTGGTNTGTRSSRSSSQTPGEATGTTERIPPRWNGRVS